VIAGYPQMGRSERITAMRILFNTNLQNQVHDQVVPELKSVLRDGTKAEMLTALGLVGQLGSARRELVPLLGDLVQRKVDAEVRAAAAGALSQLGADAEKAAPALVTVFRESILESPAADSELTMHTARALVAIGKPAVKGLTKLAYADSKSAVRIKAIEVIAEMGVGVKKEALQPLTDQLRFETNPEVRAALATAIDRIK
jgi:hypothetical protein